jgi:SSS family transporter
MTTSPVDLAILVGYLAAMVALGLWIGRGPTTAADYSVGDRSQAWWLILFSIVATETSSVTFLSIPGFAYDRDLTWLQIAFGFLIGRFVVAQVILPQFFRGSFFTAYEVLNQRFGGAAQSAASVVFLLTRTLADGLRLYLPAIVLEEMTGFSITAAVIILGIATILYTYFGGMRAVLWTDFVQFATYMAGAAVALWILLDRVPGGFAGVWERAAAAGKLRVIDPTLDLSQPYALWAGLAGGVFITFGSHGVDQMMVQRYLSARGLADARRALRASGLVVVAQFAVFLFIGLCLWAFYQDFPPAHAFDRPDRVFARFIVQEMPVGLVGFLLGAIYAAAMGSSLNACATTAVRDLWLPLQRGRSTPERELRMTRVLTAVFGALQIAVGIGGRHLTGSVVGAVLGIAAFTSGIVLGLFFLGMFAERVGERAALAGLVVGFSGMLAIFFGTRLAWPWYAMVGSSMTFAAGWLASLAWPRRQSDSG